MPTKRVTILGAKGAMGVFFQSWLSRNGHDVTGIDKEDWSQAESLVAHSDLVLVAVPIAVTCEVIRQIAPLLDGTTVLADITSVKQEPVATMLSCYAGPVVGLHPMFGPTSTSVRNQVLINCGGRQPDQLEWLFDLWRYREGTVLESTPTEHDHMMATIQAARHFSTFAFGCHLHNEDVDLNRTLAFTSPIYRLELGMVGRLFAQQPELYAEIIYRSDEGKQILRRYHEFFGKLLQELEDDNRSKFIERFNDTRSWFGPLAGEFLDESSLMLNAATLARNSPRKLIDAVDQVTE